jgi:hypothetical protein
MMHTGMQFRVLPHCLRVYLLSKRPYSAGELTTEVVGIICGEWYEPCWSFCVSAAMTPTGWRVEFRIKVRFPLKGMGSSPSFGGFGPLSRSFSLHVGSIMWGYKLTKPHALTHPSAAGLHGAGG